jgi:histidine ammonia-lyase
MATFAARRLLEMADNTCGIVAIELLSAAQGLDFRAPLKSTDLIEAVKAELRERVAFYDKDRYFAPDIEKAKQWVSSGALKRYMPPELLPSA